MASVKELNDFGQEVAKNIGELRTVFGKVCEELRSRATTEAEIKMFNDTEAGLKTIAFGDGAAIIVAKPVEQTPVVAVKEEPFKVEPGADGFIDKLAIVAKAKEMAKPEPFIAELEDLISKYNTALAEEKQKAKQAVAPETAAVPVVEETAAMSDTEKSVMSMLNLSDLGDMDQIKSAITALSDFKVNTERILAAQKVKTPDELVMKIVSVEQALAKKDTEVRDAIVLHDAQSAVDRAVLDGAITESHREWAVDFAKRDMKAFSDFVRGVPASMKTPGTIALADQKLGQNHHELNAPEGVALSDKGFDAYSVACTAMGKEPTMADYKAMTDAQTASEANIPNKGKKKGVNTQQGIGLDKRSQVNQSMAAAKERIGQGI